MGKVIRLQSAQQQGQDDTGRIVPFVARPEPPPLTRLLATCPECHTQRRCRPVRLWVRELPAAWEQGKRPKVRCEVCGRIWTPEPGECVLR